MVKALLDLLRSGCPWRDLPCEDLPWRTIYGYFVRWRDTGLWTRIFGSLAKRARGRLHFIDASHVRVHQRAANVRGGQAGAAMGQSRGGLTTKIHALCDGRGRAVHLLLSAGNVADITMAPALVEPLRVTQVTTLVADKGYDSDQLRALLVEDDIFPCLALNKTRREKRPFHRGYYRHRHHVENFFCTIKRHRRIATRYDKLAVSYLSLVTLAAILDWIRQTHFSNTP